MRVLAPNGMAVVMVAVMWTAEGVVDASHDHQEPGDKGENLVSDEVVAREFLALGERVVCPQSDAMVSTVGELQSRAIGWNAYNP